MVKKSINRDKAISVKMSQSTYDDFCMLAHSKDLMPSTMAFLVLKQFLAEQLGEEHATSHLDLL
jgi:hypothetical protein